MTEYDKEAIADLILDFVKAGLLSKRVAEAMTEEERVSYLQQQGVIKHDET